MRKTIAMLCAFLLVCALGSVPALAEATALGESSLVMDQDQLMEYEFTEEDIEEGIFLILSNEEDTLEIVFSKLELQIPVEEFFAQLEADAQDPEKGITSYGTTAIHDVDAYFQTLTVDEENYILYFLLDGEDMVQITIWYADEEAGDLSAEIIGTLERAKGNSDPIGRN